MSVVVRYQFEGVHSWPGAPRGCEEAHLIHPHRHMFHVEATKVVDHAERDVEFIGLRREMERYSRVHLKGPHFMSCEAMAVELLRRFDLRMCRVFEDGENGAEVVVDESRTV